MDQGDEWLSLEPATKPVAAPRRKKAKRKAGKRKAVKVEAAVKLPMERKRARSMVKALTGTSRMWACDGEYVYFRPTRVVDGVKTVVANPTTYSRHQNFIAQGHYKHVETQDDVEIYAVSPESPFARKGQYLGEMSDNDVLRATAIAACKRDWVLYVDCLEELAGRIKGRFDPNFAATVYQERLAYLENLIAMRGGPSSAECSAGLANVRQRRGTGSGKLIMLPSGMGSDGH